jgi:hypothetical protein
LLAGILIAGVARATAQDSVGESPPSAASSEGVGDETGPAEEVPGLPAWLRPRETPIADSIEAAVEKYVREHFAPCGAAGDAVPCFPVSLEVKGRQYSVRETLDNLQLDNRPVPGGPPTAAEMIQYGANPRPTSASVGFDPKAVVCQTKQLLQRIQGKSRKYYLYRVWDETGERAVLRDRPLDPNALAGSPHVHYVPLGEFEDECEAIKAYRRSTHEVRVRREAESAERANEPEVELRSDPEPE